MAVAVWVMVASDCSLPAAAYQRRVGLSVQIPVEKRVLAEMVPPYPPTDDHTPSWGMVGSPVQMTIPPHGGWSVRLCR